MMNNKTVELALTPIQRGLYETKVAGKEAVVVFRRRNRSNERLLSIATEFNPKVIDTARALAKRRHISCWIATQVTLNGKPKLSYAVPVELWSKVKSGVADFPVGPEAQKAYETNAEVLKGFSVTEHRANGTAQSQPRPAKTRETAQVTTTTKHEVVNSIARSVAHELGGDATMNMPPMTRAELFSVIENAVNKATRQIGFHS